MSEPRPEDMTSPPSPEGERDANNFRKAAEILRDYEAGKPIDAIGDGWLVRFAAHLSRLRAGAAPRPTFAEWAPIETAPEATRVLVFIPTAKRDPVRIGKYGLKANGQRLWVYGGEFAFDVGHATIWTPLPEPPASLNLQTEQRTEPKGESWTERSRALGRAGFDGGNKGRI